MSDFARLASFEGRSGRPGFWWAVIGAALVLLAPVSTSGLLSLLGLPNWSPTAALDGEASRWAVWQVAVSAAYLAILPIIAWFLLATLVRRCHDRNYSGWFLLVLVVPVVQVWPLIELALLGSLGEDNKAPAVALDSQVAAFAEDLPFAEPLFPEAPREADFDPFCDRLSSHVAQGVAPELLVPFAERPHDLAIKPGPGDLPTVKDPPVSPGAVEAKLEIVEPPAADDHAKPTIDKAIVETPLLADNEIVVVQSETTPETLSERIEVPGTSAAGEEAATPSDTLVERDTAPVPVESETMLALADEARRSTEARSEAVRPAASESVAATESKQSPLVEASDPPSDPVPCVIPSAPPSATRAPRTRGGRSSRSRDDRTVTPQVTYVPVRRSDPIEPPSPSPTSRPIAEALPRAPTLAQADPASAGARSRSQPGSRRTPNTAVEPSRWPTGVDIEPEPRVPLMLMPLWRYARFDGRATRSEFWLFMMFQAALLVVLAFGVLVVLPLGEQFTLTLGAGVFLILASLFIPTMAVTSRRLHDRGLSFAWWLVNLIPVLGNLVGLVLVCLDGTHGRNRYGSDPRLG